VEQKSDTLSAILQHPGNLVLPRNQAFATSRGVTQVSMRAHPHGHITLYGPHGRRILLADPEGHPLHECEWAQSPDGKMCLVSARIFLDWNQWVGITPSGLINTMTLDLSTRSGWQTLTRQDLRLMASKMMGVTLEEVEFFYTDEDLVIDPSGRATIQQRKDAFFVLENGTFEQAQFMSCMSAMHWEAIDYLPVVELFTSLLPGTGSATFELIRGLYDDQNPGTPQPLHYRGIPTYPSEAAFGLFSNFFSASCAGSESPFTVFLDAPRSHEVSWLPHAQPPVRYVDSFQQACLTVKQRKIQKVTIATDSTGLPFSSPNSQGMAPCGRTVSIQDNQLVLQDGTVTKRLPINPKWDVGSEQLETIPARGPMGTNWRNCFPEGIPAVSPQDAFSAVLLYPDDESVIEEYASQPFVADFLDDLFEQDERLSQARAQARQVFIHGFEASLGSCMLLDPPRPHTLLYSHGAFAQKQAQMLWNQLAQRKQLDWLPSFQFLSFATGKQLDHFDWVYRWIPFSDYDTDQSLHDHLQRIVETLAPQGLAFVAGPDSLPSHAAYFPIQVLFGELVSDLQPFKIHQSILPKSKLHSRLHVWCVHKT